MDPKGKTKPALHPVLEAAVLATVEIASANPTGIEVWPARFDALVAQLQAHERVVVLHAERRPGLAPSRVRALFAAHALVPDDATVGFYAANDGLSFAWAARDDHDDELGVASFPSLEVVLATPPRVDYGVRSDSGVMRIGFDFPGEFYTPAFVADRHGMRVEVGDDYGTFDDGRPRVPFESYVEGVFATWGSNVWRQRLFGFRPEVIDATQDPRSYFQANPVSIDSLLPPSAENTQRAADIAASLPSDPRLARLLGELRAAASVDYEPQKDGRVLVRMKHLDGTKRLSFVTIDELAVLKRF